MADIVAIQVLLQRPDRITPGEYRRQLNDSFSKLTPDQAGTLLERILTLDGSRIPHDFRRLSTFVRAELLMKLAGRLGNQRRAEFYAGLTGRGGPADQALQKGLRHVFPEGTEVHREKFRKALEKPQKVGTPTVTLEFRSHYLKPSSDNNCGTKRFAPTYLGLAPRSGKNWMEIRGTVWGDHTGVEYEFTRKIDKLTLYRWRDGWESPVFLEDEPDDSFVNRTDEDYSVEHDHIYVLDGPGPPNPPNPSESKVKSDHILTFSEYLYILNATETVWVKGDAGWAPGPSLRWFSVSWLEKLGSKWDRKLGHNAILPGDINEVSKKTSGEGPKNLKDAHAKKTPPVLPYWPYGRDGK